MSTPAPSPVPANVPTHVQNYTTWWWNGTGSQVEPASWMATWVTYIETASSTAANAFHAAGGKYAVAFTDPNYYFVSPTVTSPGNYAESAFGHGSNGVRTQRPQSNGTEYYLVPTSLASQAGYQGIVQAIKAGGGFNYIYADGVSDSLSESLYRMSPTPVEITTDAQYISGMKHLFYAPLPMIINGYMNGNPMHEVQDYLGASNVAAIFGESCFTTYTHVINGQLWIDMANALLATTSARHPAVCAGRGTLSDNRPLRIYYLASWWLTYDPGYSISWTIFSSCCHGAYVFPEQLLVPAQPVQSAGTNIGSLKDAGGAYIRQFAACYHDRSAWGPCAAVVNQSTATTTMPPAAASYHHSLALDANNLFDGGQVTLSSSVPSSLAPGTAVILFK